MKPLAILLIIALVILGGFIAAGWISARYERRIALDVVNQTSSAIESVQLADADGSVILRVGPIVPGASITSTIRFDGEQGDMIVSQSGQKSRLELSQISSTEGPYHYEVTVTAKQVTLEYRVHGNPPKTLQFSPPTNAH